MLQVTENATALLARYLEEMDDDRSAAIRFTLEGEGFALEFDHPHPGDALFRHNGRVVLLLDRPIYNSLTNNTLDVKVTSEGPSLALV